MQLRIISQLEFLSESHSQNESSFLVVCSYKHRLNYLLKSTIKIKKTYSNFSAENQLGLIGLYEIKNTVTFPSIPNQEKNIYINNEKGQKVIFGLTYDNFNTRFLNIDEKVFSVQTLQEISNLFSIHVLNHPLINIDFKQGYFDLEKKRTAFAALQIDEEKNIYLLIYGRSGTNVFEENQIYVHGIWSIEVAEELKKQLNL